MPSHCFSHLNTISNSKVFLVHLKNKHCYVLLGLTMISYSDIIPAFCPALCNITGYSKNMSGEYILSFFFVCVGFHLHQASLCLHDWTIGWICADKGLRKTGIIKRAACLLLMFVFFPVLGQYFLCVRETLRYLADNGEEEQCRWHAWLQYKRSLNVLRFDLRAVFESVCVSESMLDLDSLLTL